MATIEQRIEQVRNDREHGSRWLVRETLLILRDLAQSFTSTSQGQMAQLYSVGNELAQARPAMAAISSAVGRVLNVQGDAQAVVQSANQLLLQYDSSTENIAKAARPFLQGRLMTCSISGTVLDVLIQCRNTLQEVIVLEGRPRYEGRAMVEELAKKGVAVTLITDAQADIFLPLCHAVVVGADSVLAGGDVLNKAGTALLAWAAQGHGIPFYALCETLKISPRQWSNDEVAQWRENTPLLEEKEPEEVLEQPIEGVKVRNFYFDRTPSPLITNIITEQGILSHEQIATIARQVQQNEQVLKHNNMHG